MRPLECLDELGDGGDQLVEVLAGQIIELLGEEMADGGLPLPGEVLEHGHLVERQPRRDLPRAEPARKDERRLPPEGLFDRLGRPALPRLRHDLLHLDHVAFPRPDDLDLAGRDRRLHLLARPPEEGGRIADADVRLLMQENGANALDEVRIEHGKAPRVVAAYSNINESLCQALSTPMTATQREAAIFGDRLRELREKRELSLRALAEVAGMSYTYISDMERGLRVPTLTTVIRLAVALDCKVTDLVGVFDKTNLRSLVAK